MPVVDDDLMGTLGADEGPLAPEDIISGGDSVLDVVSAGDAEVVPGEEFVADEVVSSRLVSLSPRKIELDVASGRKDCLL